MGFTTRIRHWMFGNPVFHRAFYTDVWIFTVRDDWDEIPLDFSDSSTDFQCETLNQETQGFQVEKTRPGKHTKNSGKSPF